MNIDEWLDAEPDDLRATLATAQSAEKSASGSPVVLLIGHIDGTDSSNTHSPYIAVSLILSPCILSGMVCVIGWISTLPLNTCIHAKRM